MSLSHCLTRGLSHSPSPRYRTIEKPPRFEEKGNLEAHLFNIHTQQRGKNRHLYNTGQGKDLRAINKKWEKLEKVEHDREIALRDEVSPVVCSDLC